MKYFQSDSEFLHQVLNVVDSKAGDVKSVEDLCFLAETLALLKEALKAGDEKISDSKPTKPETDELFTNDEETASATPESDNDMGALEQQDVSVEDSMILLCDGLLASMAEQAKSEVSSASALELQRLLSVYSLLPFQADVLVDTIEAEVNARLPKSGNQPMIMVEDLLHQAREKSEFVQKELFQDEESSGMRAALKNGIMSLFRSVESADGNESSDTLPKEIASMIQDSITTTVEASSALQQMQESLHVSIDSIGQRNSEGTYFELGRCQELIANYRRVEFSTGTRRSRYDEEGRKIVSKRVLSRLLP